MSLCLNVNKGPPITKSLMPQNVPSLSPFLSILTSPRHPIIFSYPSLSSPILAFRPPIAISTSCLGVASTSHCSCSLNSSLHSSSASLVGAYTWMTVEFSKRESKFAFMILSLTGFHFRSVLFTFFFRMSPTSMMLLFEFSRVQDALICCCLKFSTVSSSYFAQIRYVKIVVRGFPGNISSPTYLIE